MWSACSSEQTIVPSVCPLLFPDPVADVACAIHQLDASGSPNLALHKCNVPGHAQLYFRSRCDFAKNAKACADSFGQHAHPLEPPVFALQQLLSVDSTSVVADRDAKLGGPIFDLGLNMLRSGMAVCIQNRLQANGEEILTQ